MKNILIFLFGAACGAAGALVWLRKDYYEKLEETTMKTEELEKQIEKNTEKVNKNAENMKKTAKELTKKARQYNKMCEDLEYSKTQELSDTQKEMLRKNIGAEALVREDRDVGRPDLEEEEEELPFEEQPEKPRKEEPYGISDQDFIYDGKDDYDKVTLFWYQDDILAEEDGTVIEDPKYLVGDNWKKYIGKYVEDEAFIRNERVTTDYNIVCENLRYADEFGEE